MNTRVVLAYSGGLKASVGHSLARSRRTAHRSWRSCSISVRARIWRTFASARSPPALSRCHVVDAREEFARDFVVPSLKADALLEGRYPTSTALGRAVIAKTLVTIARIEDAKTVAHAGTGKDHLRLTDAAHAIDSSLKVIACAEAWTLSDSELANVAERHQIAATGESRLTSIGTSGAVRSADRWMRRRRGTCTESALRPGRPCVEIEFARGVPIALNGVTMPPAELIDSLATIGAEHGIGRLSRVKARDGWSGVARRSTRLLQPCCCTRLTPNFSDRRRPGAVQRFAPAVASAYVDVIDRGEWFSNLRPALDAFVNEVQQHVTGMVRLTLFKGGVTAAGITQPAAAKP